MKNAPRLAALTAIAMITMAATVVGATEGVSPGAGDRLAAIRDGCPAFSWGAVDGAAFYEVVAYRLPEGQEFAVLAGAELTEANEVLYTRVTGAALSWTPDLERCFAPGGSYIWYVRAVFEEGEGLSAGDWSQGLYFTVAAAPSAEEVRQAIGVLQRYLEAGGGEIEELSALVSDAGTDADAGHRSRSTTDNRIAGEALPGTAAIKGEQTDPTGVTYGVYGVTNSSTDGSLGVVGEATATSGDVYGIGGVTMSPEGAGVVAFNVADGPDLQLKSETAGDAWLTEAGLDRGYPGPVAFEFSNSDPSGSMTLRIDGIDVVTTATDQDTLGGMSCATDEVAKWDGSAWLCAPDVDTDADTLAELGPFCTSGELAEWTGSDWVCEADQDTLGGMSCGTGEVAKWDGSAWLCAPDVDTDSDTLAALGPLCASGELAEWTGSDWICEADDDTLGALDCGFFPNRVAKWNGSEWGCAKDDDTTYDPGPGVIIDNGRILLDPAAFSKRISTLDSIGDVGYFNSLAIGADGLGLVSYHDATNESVKVAHCDNVLCTSATLSTPDSGDYYCYAMSVAIGADGLGLISYYDFGLQVAHCDNVPCSSATLSDLDSRGFMGESTSVAIGADGLGLISYYDRDNADLKVAHCDDVLCSSATLSTLDSAGAVGGSTSVAIGADGLGLISYYDGASGDLKVAHCDDVLCSSATLSILDSAGSVGAYTSLAVGADGLGLISYYDLTNQDLKVAHCDDVLCSSATLSILDSAGDVGRYTSLAIGADGLGLISYRDSTNGDLKAAQCHDVLCTSATLSILDDRPGAGMDTSVAIGADGLPLISYRDNANKDLKVVHLPFGL